MSDANSEILKAFYSALAAKNHEAMTEQYSDEVIFEDPVFGKLEAKQAKAMWRMLVEKSGDLEIIYRDIEVSDDAGSANWEATYTFKKTGRTIVNKIHAQVKFRDGKIIEHKDSFSFWNWNAMAFGLVGLLFGWTPFMQDPVKKEALAGLQLYMKRKRLL